MTVKLDFNHKRDLYPPDAGKGTFQGEDVLALKATVSRFGCWPWGEFDEAYSNAFAHGQKNSKGGIIKGHEGMAGVQRVLKISPSSGFYGKGTHEALLNTHIRKGLAHAGDRTWNQNSINLYQGFQDHTAAERIVIEIFSWWDWLVAREGLWHYEQIRPIPELYQRHDPPHLPSYGDCSGTSILCAWLGGALSPDRLYGFSGSGNTGSLSISGFRISTKDIDKYARNHYVLAFFGPWIANTKHVIACKSSTRFYSHGHESAPEIYTNILGGRRDLTEVRAYQVI
jgi:hypothetical protein